MKFLKWDYNQPLFFNKFNFYQPADNSICKIPNLILVPLLAFDLEGHRLGYGKGFYDRFYEKNKNLIYVGYGYDFQIIKKLPVNSYDMKLNAIVTNNYLKKILN